VDKVHDNMIKKDDSERVLKIVKPELSSLRSQVDKVRNNMIKKNSLNLTATKGYIDIGNRRLVKTANAIDKYDIVKKGKLDDACQSQSKGLADYGERKLNSDKVLMRDTHYSILQFVGKIIFIKEVHGEKAVNVFDFSFDGERFIRIPMNVEVIIPLNG
ncbi:hypothetical protein BDFB_014444, partial [Asbolus verrucosus]